MRHQTLYSLTLAAALSLAGLAVAQDMAGMDQARPAAPATQTTEPPAAAFSAVDVGNTICPVSNDKVGDSKLVEVYDGKVYHLCCPDCHDEFAKDPAKFAKAVADNPAKYGVK